MAKINENFIVNLQGKDFVTYEGLLDLAHQMKLKSIKTELIQLPTKENNNQCIMKAIAETEDGKTFEGYGDADNTNVNKLIARHLIRMTETRAKARALRDLTNVGMTAIEELGGEEEDKPTNYTNKGNKPSTKQNRKPVDKDKQAIVDASLASDKQLNFIYKLSEQKGFVKTMPGYIKQTYGKDTSKALTKKEASEIIKMLQEIGEKQE